MSTAAQIARKLNTNQIIYLFIANSLWERTDVFVEESIEDIEDTGGEFDGGNWFALDYIDGDFNDEHVAEVITAWKHLHDDGVYEDCSTLDVLDSLFGGFATIESFQNVVIHVAQETGSYTDSWNPRTANDVEIAAILEAAGARDIVENYLNDQVKVYAMIALC